MKKLLLPFLLLFSGLAFSADALRARVNMPAGPTPTAGTPTVSLTCQPPTSGTTPTGYNFYRSSVSGGPYALLNSIPEATCAYTDTTVSYATTYYYVATSVSGAYVSSYSNMVQAVIPQNPTPNPPTGLTVTSITTTNIQFKWTAPVGDTVYAYRMYRKPASRTWWTTYATGIKTTTFTDSNPLNTAADYEVKAVEVINGSNVLSGPSNVVLVSKP